ncbi:hypothetical protein GUJ93_ZPchr0015g6907 [Zizania palustris]|uniref:Uncharacterized protein n=1 Tax=Zizania palustris TaxID=103762 RepID=A0A8J5SYJ0_ZIZPA|nr:hypothetical protein GUJ93_ZPchr0015g6907 [Zizania palustris]
MTPAQMTSSSLPSFICRSLYGQTTFCHFLSNWRHVTCHIIFFHHVAFFFLLLSPTPPAGRHHHVHPRPCRPRALALQPPHAAAEAAPREAEAGVVAGEKS